MPEYVTEIVDGREILRKKRKQRSDKGKPRKRRGSYRIDLPGIKSDDAVKTAADALDSTDFEALGFYYSPFVFLVATALAWQASFSAELKRSDYMYVFVNYVSCIALLLFTLSFLMIYLFSVYRQCNTSTGCFIWFVLSGVSFLVFLNFALTAFAGVFTKVREITGIEPDRENLDWFSVLFDTRLARTKTGTRSNVYSNTVISATALSNLSSTDNLVTAIVSYFALFTQVSSSRKRNIFGDELHQYGDSYSFIYSESVFGKLFWLLDEWTKHDPTLQQAGHLFGVIFLGLPDIVYGWFMKYFWKRSTRNVELQKLEIDSKLQSKGRICTTDRLKQLGEFFSGKAEIKGVPDFMIEQIICLVFSINRRLVTKGTGSNNPEDYKKAYNDYKNLVVKFIDEHKKYLEDFNKGTDEAKQAYDKNANPRKFLHDSKKYCESLINQVPDPRDKINLGGKKDDLFKALEDDTEELLTVKAWKENRQDFLQLGFNLEDFDNFDNPLKLEFLPPDIAASFVDESWFQTRVEQFKDWICNVSNSPCDKRCIFDQPCL